MTAPKLTLLLGGLAPVTDGDRISLRQRGPLRSCKPQRPPDHGLFDVAGRGQQDLVDLARNTD